MNVFGVLKKIISTKFLGGIFLGFVAVLMFAPITLQIKQTNQSHQEVSSVNITFKPNVAYADNKAGVPMCDGLDEFFSNPGKCIVMSLLYVVFWISAQFVTLAGWILDIILAYTLESLTYNNQQGWVTQGWALVRDFINIFFIAILLTIAGNMLLNRQGGSWQKQLINVAVAALLINFSLFFVKVIIDGGNITARVFYRAMDLETVDTLRTPNGGAVKMTELDLPIKVRSLTAAVLSKTNMQKFLGQISANDAAMGAFNSDWIIAYLYMIVGVAIYVYLTYMFLNIAFYFFARTIGLWFLMIASPLAFLSAVDIPWLRKIFQAKGLSDVGWDAYFSNLAKMAFQPAIFCFFMYLTVISLNLFVFAVPESRLSFGGDGTSLLVTIIYFLIPLGVVFGIIILTKRYTDKFSTSFGEFLTTGVKSVVGAVGGIVLGGAGYAARSTLGAALAGSKTLGRGAAIARRARMNMATGRGNAISNRLALLRGNTMRNLQNYGKKGSWDFRDLGKKLGGFKKPFSRVGLDLDTGVNFENAQLFGKSYLDLGKLPLPFASKYGYNLASFIEEGRKGGVMAHGNKVDEYFQKLFDEIKKDKQEEFDIKMKEKRAERDKKKKNMEDERKDIIDMAFNGNTGAFNEFDKNSQKLRNAIDAVDGGYSSNAEIKFAEEGLKDAIDSYRADPIKNPLSGVIKRILAVEDAQKKMFMLEQEEINQMSAGDARDARQAALDEANTKFTKLINETKASLAEEFNHNAGYDVADEAGDTEEQKKLKKALRDDKAKLAAYEDQFKHARDGGVIDDAVTLNNSRLKKLEGVDKKIREAEIKQKNGSLNQKMKQVQKIVDAKTQLNAKNIQIADVNRDIALFEDEVDATGAVTRAGYVSTAQRDVTNLESEVRTKQAEKLAIERNLAALGKKSELEDRRNELQKRNLIIDKLLPGITDFSELAKMNREKDDNIAEIASLDTRLASFDGDEAALNAQKAANDTELKDKEKEAEDAKKNLEDIKKQKETLEGSKKTLAEDVKKLKDKADEAVNERQKKEEAYDQFLEKQFGKDKDEMAEQLKQYEKKNREYKDANMFVEKQEEQLREENKQDFAEIKKHAEDKRRELNDMGRRLSEIATLGTFRGAAEAANVASWALDIGTENEKPFGEKHDEFVNRIRGIEIDKDGNEKATTFNKSTLNIESKEDKDKDKKDGDKDKKGDKKDEKKDGKDEKKDDKKK
ncbi:MAG TPA: hypothetical protein VGE63_02945 [Candidatus Paceibacterota bacterium]